MDMIVMGTLGRRGAERILIGSVTQRVIEYATCPVLVVK
jgi:nucleotide-binding universal stress UspA family protein